MLGNLKEVFFFPVAFYFAFFAKIQLKKWAPKIVVVTGSSGKTTLFSMIDAQINERAHFSHHANSAIGVPFDILDLHRTTLKLYEWPMLFLKTPFRAFKKPYEEKLYIVECDADRPGEGKFLAGLLQPDITLWVSVSRTHSMNFDKLVPEKFKNVDEAIAYEFGHFLERTSELCIIDGDNKYIESQKQRTQAEIREVHMQDLEGYEVNKEGTEFTVKKDAAKHAVYRFKALHPKEIFYSIEMTRILCEHLQITFDPLFKRLALPPARSSLFRGIKNITIVDSTYNANLASMRAIMGMFKMYPSKIKWAVVGDMLEQGKEEEEEHEKLADEILQLDVKRVVLLGPRTRKSTYPILQKKLPKDVPVNSFESPKEVLDFLLSHIHGGETILFKGARFLEGVIENLLLDKREKKLLSRREKVWEERRRKWGLVN
ncbi:MAG: glutamate ligase domain-containing protein [Candidatus Levyibacteriota bacterium]